MSIKTLERGSTAALSKNFTAKEFACTGKNCCSTLQVDEELVEILQRIRSHFAVPVTVTSAYRCPERNAAVGGAVASQHLKGKAADISVKGIKPLAVARYAESIGVMGIGLYNGFVHIDTRGKKSFWKGKSQQRCQSFLLPRLEKGSRGDAVMHMQRLLNALDFSCGKADGIWGDKTQQALEDFIAAGGWEQLLQL